MPVFPSPAELVEAIPVILSLIVIEGLLSVDNSLAIAAMVRQVPAERRSAALTWGMAGAYFFRCVCLLFAAWIIENWWIKVIGAAYLIWLMCRELTGRDDHDALDADGVPTAARQSFTSVVLGILLLDASLSVDNVVAAIAMTPKLWAVYVGVGVGILALRLLAGWAIRLIERYPILEKTAFLLVGFVGAILLVEICAHVQIAPLQKFSGICLITAATLLYGASEGLQRALAPVLAVVRWPMLVVARVIGWILWPFAASARWIGATLRGRTEKV